ncbi:MAG TPA: FAD-dependent oxidoreductase, partial [Stellaceae bacterium]|nr:FAD-dependent oxidoreductase [Stellaceae bacterium]
MAERTIRADVKGLADGEIRLASDGDDKVVLLRHGGELRAFSATCPHYGAPLEKGLVCGGRLVCPWHKASFDAADGSLVEPPALEGLARYPIRLDGDSAIVTLAPMPAKDSGWDGEADEDEGTFGIVGTGAAGLAAARALREFGFAGRIVMLGQEEGTPYDRPALSKEVPAGKLEPEEASLKSSFYQDNAIDFRRMEVEIIDVANRRIAFHNGAGLNCDALLIASGSQPKKPDLPGTHLGNVLVLRSQEDARHLADAAKEGHKVVIMGSSFIGLEVATGLAKRGLKVDVVSSDTVPLARPFGPEIGA